MRGHPLNHNISIRSYNDSASASRAAATMRLRRLPHVFSKVLELPFRSDADVAVDENAEQFRFVAEIGDYGGGSLRAHAVEIHPGITKIVVRNNYSHEGEEEGSSSVALFLEQLMLDTWRFRLPAFTRPELTMAAFVDGKLIVTVPKGGGAVARESWRREGTLGVAAGLLESNDEYICMELGHWGAPK